MNLIVIKKDIRARKEQADQFYSFKNAYDKLILK